MCYGWATLESLGNDPTHVIEIEPDPFEYDSSGNVVGVKGEMDDNSETVTQGTGGA